MSVLNEVRRIKNGNRVYHPMYGEGTVLGTAMKSYLIDLGRKRRNFLEVRVNLKSGKSKVCDSSQLVRIAK